ncbi:hypothetical protein B9Z55_007281 [Caenorhabditis nigoni]|uniref:Uncharacterized protein n=1 Tax=Caenorhabditis nigoni TaxID=1611254 RepID=A0A2G5V8V8_9PELO|nr:hypothetical protein B9Z55_007281 [Caenorhabditis nigoni]
MDNNFRREQNLIRELQGDLEWEKDRKRTMVYRKDETDRDIERHPERHAKTMEKVRMEHEERVNAAIVYAAELTRRVECMDRMEERQKEQLEKIKEAGGVIFEKVNAAIVYAAELTRRVGCMGRMEEKQKEQIEKIQDAGDVIFAENDTLEQDIAQMKNALKIAKRHQREGTR